MYIIAFCLLIIGLCMGSFVNATVWRLHEQDKEIDKKKPDKKYLDRLSILKGRSMCSHCHHELAAKDLVPLLSWLCLKGRCRYCHKPIADTPLVEVATGLMFLASYIWWPYTLSFSATIIFVLWLGILVGFMILVVYDLRWLLLPNRVIFPLYGLALIQLLIIAHESNRPLQVLFNAILGVIIGGGIFYLLFQISAGRWIGGGDVKLGWLLGIIAGTAARSILFIFIAALFGSFISLPLLLSGRLKRTSTIPFGPFLILGAVVVQFFGADILNWYQHLFILY